MLRIPAPAAIASSLFQPILAQRERWFYWSPVWLGIGIGCYFVLPAELPLFLTILGAFLSAALGFLLRHRRPLLAAGMLALALLAAGMAAAHMRALWHGTPMLQRALGPVSVTGIVLEREVRTKDVRLTLGELHVERLEPAATPVKVRLTLRKDIAAPAPGSRVEVLANLLPPMMPAFPGGYDFRRAAYFEQIGAYGVILLPPKMLGAAADVSQAERWREQAVEVITQSVAGAPGAIAAALMTGERGTIDDATNDAMRAAGTTHLLSISGMHIGMVGGFVFFLLRALLAALPGVALRWPIKQIAAIAALAVIIAYTWLVGAPIPAQRAVLMAGIVFIAILLNRQAVTMRTVALAALAILLVFPESLLNPGFQMSFAAILFLVAAYERWQQRPRSDTPPSWPRKGFNYLAGIVITSLLAGLATMPFGVWHFHRVQIYGVLGNLIAVPLTGIVVMPAMVLAYPLMPFGLADWPLQIMGAGLLGVTESARWIAALPLADLNSGQISLLTVLLLCAGGLWLCVWQGGLRWLGLGLISLGLSAAFLKPLPVPRLLVHAEGQVLLRADAGGWLAARAAPRGFIYEQWQEAFASGEAIRSWRALPHAATQTGEVTSEPEVRCDRLGCVHTRLQLALPNRAAALSTDCQKAKIIIAPDWRLKNCAGLVIDRSWLRRHGTTTLYDDGEIVTTRRDSQRPWE